LAPSDPRVLTAGSRWLIGGFFGLGVFLRIYGFWSPELWTDEYGTWWVVAGGWGDVARRVLRYGGQSPLYYLIVKLWTDALGPGPVSLRLPSILCGIGTLGVAYPLGMRVFNDRHAALLTLAAFAVHEKLIWYSQEARPYSLALLCTMLSFLFYLRLLDSGKLADRIGYVVVTALLYYTHYLFGVVVLVQILYLCLRQGLAWVRDQGWRAAYLVLGLISLPGAAQLWTIGERRESMSWFSQGPAAPFNLAVEMLGPPVFSAVGLVVLAVGLGESDRGGADRNGRRDLVLLWLLAPIAIFGVASVVLGVALLYSRYLLSIAPAGVLVVAWLMASARRTRWRKWAPLSACLAVTTIWHLVPALATFGAFSARPDERWRSVAHEVERSARDDDLILVQSGFFEGNLLARGQADALLVSGLHWPFTANLSSTDRYEIVGLPHSVNSQTKDYVPSVVMPKARQRERVWVVGSEDIVAHVTEALLAEGRFRLLRRSSHGSTWVILVAQRGG